MWKKVKYGSEFLWEVLSKFVTDNSLNYSASIAFFTIFSLPGILIAVILIAGSVYGEKTVKGELHHQIQNLVGDSSADQIAEIISNLENAEFNYLTLAIAIVTLVYGATSVFSTIQDGINVIWGIRPRPKGIALKFFLNKLLSFAMIVTIGFLMLISLSVDMLVVLFQDTLVESVGSKSVGVLSIVKNISFYSIVLMVFIAVYKFLPDAKVGWKDTFRGAVLSTVLFMIGKYLFGFYVGNTSFGTAYGAAGSLVLLLIWVYYSSIILLIGAEFIEVYARRNNRVIKPSSASVKVVINEIEI